MAKQSIKKLTAILLAVILALSVFTLVPITASAATENKIYFDVESFGWKNYQYINCHIWAADGSGTWTIWGTKAERCTLEEDGRWSYDLSKTGNDISPSDGKLYLVIFHADTGYQTYNMVMSGSCIGDEVYATGNLLENPDDETRSDREAAWRNNPDCGSKKGIGYDSGNIIGTTLPECESNATLLASYIITHYGDTYQMSLLPVLLKFLDISTDDVFAACTQEINKKLNEDTFTQDRADATLIAIENVLNRIDEPVTEPHFNNSFRYIVLDDGTAEITGYTGSETNLTIPSEIDGYKVTSIGDCAFHDCIGLKKITIPDSVTTIGQWAFYKSAELISVIIPDSVTSIGDRAFYRCKSLSDITIPNGVTNIGEYTFDYCESLESISIPDSVTSIGDSAFRGCTRLTSITIPDSVTSIGEYAFSDCDSLESITIHDGVTTIGNSAFYGCSGLTNITIPDSVSTIGNSAFKDTVWYNNQPDGVVYAGKFAYNFKGDMPENTSIVLKEGTKGIADNAFYLCTSLTSITIPDSVTTIGNSAFNGCTSLTSITIPDSVTTIGNSAFCRCTGLTNITIPDSVTNIGYSAFYGCTGLTNITIPDSVINIGIKAFNKTAWYNNQPDGVVYAGKIAYNYKGEMPENTSIVLKDGTKGIADSAFLKEEIITTTVPDSPNAIVGVSLVTIVYQKNLTSVTIPDSVINIGSRAFYRCCSLTDIIIPDSVTSIGDEAFFDCTSLTDVYYSGSEEEWNQIAIGTNNIGLENATIHFSSEDPLPTETIVDENTGISVTTNSGAEINVENLTDSDSAKNVIAILGDSEKLVDLYDIFLTKGGVSVQPDEPATVKIPTDNKNAKVYRIEDNGTATDMNAVYDNGYMVFTTDHFSLYALVVSSGNIMGDVNGDGVISVVDATNLQKHLANIVDFDDEQLAVADTNGDGSVSIADATQIQKYLAQLIPSLG